jgi:hypothetical protein
VVGADVAAAGDEGGGDDERKASGAFLAGAGAGMANGSPFGKYGLADTGVELLASYKTQTTRHATRDTRHGQSPTTTRGQKG